MPDGQPQSQEELMRIEDVTGIDLTAGDVGEGLRFRTSRGSFNAILHRASDTDRAVIWVCGASGGFGGPGPGTYARMSERFVGEGITSLRLDYRLPNDVFECAMDLLAGVAYLKSADHKPVVVVGHSFGGAVVIAAGANSEHINGVVALSPQTYGAGMAGQVAPRKLLVVHGKADTRLSFSCGQQIYDMAQEPKELVLYEGAEHRLEECRDDLEELLGKWIPETLATEITLP
ncbi:MAG: alpha/beta fold hydrolase [Dehalococcoidia bacterium]|nr:alpha/beta fold hydrolase [Dehalococcoidia bacterium]